MPVEMAQLKATFAEAAAQPDPGARAAYLDRACDGDAELRARVEALLAAHENTDNFLQLPDSDEPTTSLPTPSELPGTKIGRYKLIEQIGEGGFGVVFMAEQEFPMWRLVALKIIKLGMDTRQVVARFEAERQALALMNHPNVAKVFDGGATETGRPYFVMELVKGIPITDFCNRQHLPIRRRLELMCQVCLAVQHAHQKGIIHRDLKPTNVLVMVQDDRPVVKVIDFGVAKAIESRLTEKTLFTDFRQLIGTPSYMSPEQAAGGLDVDTRSDVYSLGVLLYELMTGSPPFAAKELSSKAFAEMQRIICEVEPLTPSSKLSTLAGALPSIAAQRSAEPRRLKGALEGELDWIVMKCLEKDRNRRYDSAGSLARDVERYLHDEPVQACPPSAGYRLRKFATRYKGPLAATAAIAAVLIVGLGLTTWMYFRERAALRIAKANEIRASTETDRASAVASLLQELLASSNPDRMNRSEYTVRELLDDFSVGLNNQLAGKPEVEVAIRSVVGKSYWRLGVLDRAESHLKRALDMQRQLTGEDDVRVADCLIDYAWSLVDQRRFVEADACIREALKICDAQNSNPRATMRALWCWQESLLRQNRDEESIQVATKALALAKTDDDAMYPELPNILHGLADANWETGRHEEAEGLARRAVAMHRRIHGDRHPETAWGLWILGSSLRSQQRFVEAEPPLREALSIFSEYFAPDHRAVRGITKVLSDVLRANGDHAAAEALSAQIEVESVVEQNTGGN